MSRSIQKPLPVERIAYAFGAGTGPAFALGTATTQLRNGVLVTTMISTAFQLFAVAVLASRLIDDFGISRFEIGLIGSLNTGVGALSAPIIGRLTDRIGPRQATIASQAMMAVGMGIMALSTNVWILVVSAVVCGFPQGWGNPATNALIAERVAPGKRGTITGIKQSGVTLGLFLAGMTLPALSDQFGSWRVACGLYAGLFAIFSLLPLLLPREPVEQFAEEAADTDTHAPAETPSERSASSSRRMMRLAVYAFLMGSAGGAISRYLALFAEEEVGMTNTEAGMVVALSGLCGMATRVIAGKVAEHRIAPINLLSILAWVGGVVSVLLMAATTVGAWILWPIAILYAVGHAAWNAVAMLAIIVDVPKSEAGRASGTVMLGFLGGLTLGTPIAGLAVDATNSYQPLFIGATVLAIVAAIIIRRR